MPPSLFDSDPLLRRLEFRALTFCGVAAVVALIARGGRPDVAIGILAGGLLSAVSYWAIRSGVTTLTHQAHGGESASIGPPSRVTALLRLAGRYALLGLMAYGMIARLRLHPIGLLIGMSSVVVAASLEAVRPATGRRDM